MSHIIDLDNLKTDNKLEFVFFANNDFIIYLHRNQIHLTSFKENLSSITKFSYDHNQYSLLDMGDSVLLLFDFKELILINKLGLDSIVSLFNNNIIGRCITDIYRSKGDTEIIFGTKSNNRIQFVNYDFMSHKRIAQTSSWNMDKITNLLVEDSILYAVLDNSVIICCDMNIGKIIWKRFETSKIEPGLATYGEDLIYSCQGNIKRTNGYTTSTMRVPHTSISSILHIKGSNIVCSCNELNNICEYNIETESLGWEIVGQSQIQETVVANNAGGGESMFVRLKNYVGIINLKTGMSVSSVKVDSPIRIRRTDNHIIVHKLNTSSVLVSGTDNHDRHNFV